MPAIVDDEPMGGGAPMSIFESGPIMMYLAEKTGRLAPPDPRGKYDVAQWVGWQLANQGPKLGEQGHFRRAAESGNNGDLTYALRRFDKEAHRIYGVMNLGLFNKRYLAAGAYTIADMICYPWASSWATRNSRRLCYRAVVRGDYADCHGYPKPLCGHCRFEPCHIREAR